MNNNNVNTEVRVRVTEARREALDDLASDDEHEDLPNVSVIVRDALDTYEPLQAYYDEAEDADT